MILVSYGTRPEWLKIKPVLKELKKLSIPTKVLFTGQHTTLLGDDAYSDIELTIMEKTALIPNRHDQIVVSIIGNDDLFEDITAVLVQGDTASAFAMALAAHHRKLPLIHLEAGLRTYNKECPFPEEVYRKCISAIADLHLCPTYENAENLYSERIEKNVYVTGNTICDNLLGRVHTLGDTVLVTMHRAENLPYMDLWFTELNKLAVEYKGRLNFVFPMHPNPLVQKHKHILTDVEIRDPMPYDEFVDALTRCRFIITDSGGIQEEAAFLRKKCVVCRKYTERNEGKGEFFIQCPYPNDLVLSGIMAFEHSVIDSNISCPYGDGKSSIRVAKLIKGYYEGLY